MGTGRLCSVYLCMPSTRSGEPPEIRVPATASPWVRLQPPSQPQKARRTAARGPAAESVLEHAVVRIPFHPCCALLYSCSVSMSDISDDEDRSRMAADRRARFSVADVTAVEIQEESAVFVAADKRINVLKEDLLLPSTKAAKILCLYLLTDGLVPNADRAKAAVWRENMCVMAARTAARQLSQAQIKEIAEGVGVSEAEVLQGPLALAKQWQAAVQAVTCASGPSAVFLASLDAAELQRMAASDRWAPLLRRLSPNVHPLGPPTVERLTAASRTQLRQPEGASSAEDVTARDKLLQLYSALKKDLPLTDDELAHVRDEMLAVYAALGRSDEAMPLLDDAVDEMQVLGYLNRLEDLTGHHIRRAATEVTRHLVPCLAGIRQQRRRLDRAARDRRAGSPETKRARTDHRAAMDVDAGTSDKPHAVVSVEELRRMWEQQAAAEKAQTDANSGQREPTSGNEKDRHSESSSLEMQAKQSAAQKGTVRVLGHERDDAQLVFDEVGGSLGGLTVVALTGFKGADVADVVQEVRYLFRHSTYNTMWGSFVEACDKTSKRQTVLLVADEESVDEILKGRQEAILRLRGSRHDIIVQQREGARILIDVSHRMPHPPKGSAAPTETIDVSQLAYEGVSVDYSTLPPYSIRQPYVSLWGHGHSERPCGQVVYDDLSDPRLGGRLREAQREMAHHFGGWVTAGTTTLRQSVGSSVQVKGAARSRKVQTHEWMEAMSAEGALRPMDFGADVRHSIVLIQRAFRERRAVRKHGKKASPGVALRLLHEHSWWGMHPPPEEMGALERTGAAEWHVDRGVCGLDAQPERLGARRVQWLAQGSESADLKPGEPRVAGVYRCGKTVFQLQMDAAWDAAHGVLSYWMPGVSGGPAPWGCLHWYR